MSELIVLLSLLLTIVIGFCVIRLGNLLKDGSLLEKFSFSFGLGVGLHALELIIYSFFSIPWKPVFLLIPWVILIIIASMQWKMQANHPFPKVSLTTGQKFLLCLIIVLCLFVGFEAQLRPLYAWDGWAIWLLKAKIFFIDGKIDSSHTYYLENSYPYTLSLAITSLYSFIGHVDDRSVLLFFWIFYVATSGLLFSSLKKSLGVTKSLLVTFIFMSTQNVIRHGGRWEAGYADLALGYYFFSCILLIKNYIQLRNIRSLFLLSLFIGITSVIKNEAIPFLAGIEIVLFIYLILFKKYAHSILLFISIIPQAIWTVYKNTHHFFPNYLFYRTQMHPERIFAILINISKEAMYIERWNLLWIFFALSFLVFLLKPKRKFFLGVYAIIFFQLINYVFIFMISPYPPATHIKSVMDRLFLHLTPLSFYISTLTIL